MKSESRFLKEIENCMNIDTLKNLCECYIYSVNSALYVEYISMYVYLFTYIHMYSVYVHICYISCHVSDITRKIQILLWIRIKFDKTGGRKSETYLINRHWIN